MKTEEFEQIVKARLSKTESTLGKKAEEYAHGDRLSNFHTAAALMKVKPETVLAGLMVKHIVALYDFIREHEADDKPYASLCAPMRPYAYWDEKIGDIQAYLCLLDAMILERFAKQKDGTIS